jgi:hypothetical protein
VLRNTAYIGLPAWNKQGGGEFLEDDGEQVREVVKATGRRERPRTAWMQPKEPIFEPLIEKVIWDAVQEKLAKPRKARAPKTPEMYMAGVVVCAGCGRVMRGQRRPNFCQYSCYTYDRDRKNPSGCLRNAINQNLIEAALDRYFQDAGQTLEVLQKVQDTGDLSLLGSLQNRMGETWNSAAELVSRMTDFYTRHGCLDPEVFRPIYEHAKARGAGKPFDPKDPGNFTDLLIELYEASFNLNADTIRERLKGLEGDHRRLVRECRNLPEGSRALRQLQDEILAVEGKMDQAEGDLINVSAAVREAQAEVVRIRASMEDARKAISSDIGLRVKAEKLRGLIHQINIRFEPTGQKYPKSRAVEVEIVPKVGDAVKYRTDALLSPARSPLAPRSSARPPPPAA